MSSGAIAGATIATMLNGPKGHAQFGKPQPLHDAHVSFVTTTESKPWQDAPVFSATFNWTMLNLNLEGPVSDGPPMRGFGACFNELGWTSLQTVSEADRDAVMRELFDPQAGVRLTYCRMPIGSNDFATEAYSYDETDGDFELQHFSIDHDRKTLVPFIHAAQRYQPQLRLWASPWTPPSWMKRNHFYAEAKSRIGPDNGIRQDQTGRE